MMLAAEAVRVIQEQLIPTLKKTGGASYVEALEALLTTYTSYRKEHGDEEYGRCEVCKQDVPLGLHAFIVQCHRTPDGR